MDALLHGELYDVVRALFFNSELTTQSLGVSSSSI